MFFGVIVLLFNPKKVSEIFVEKFDELWLCWSPFEGLEKEEEKEVVEDGPNKSSILLLPCTTWLLENPTWLPKCRWTFVRFKEETPSDLRDETTGGSSIAWSKYDNFICTWTNQTPPCDFPVGEARGSQSLKGLKGWVKSRREEERWVKSRRKEKRTGEERREVQRKESRNEENYREGEYERDSNRESNWKKEIDR